MSRFLCAVAMMLVASGAHAQTVTQHDDRLVTVRAEGVPIATLLSEIARVYSIERVTIQPGLEQRPVSVALERVSPAAALVAILKASGLDFAVSGRRIVAGDWTAAGEVELASLQANRGAPPSALGPSDAPVPEREARDQATGQPAAARATHVTPEELVTLEALGDETTILPMPPVPFIANGENITYLEPNFVPYKMRRDVRALRMAIDVAKIP